MTTDTQFRNKGSSAYLTCWNDKTATLSSLYSTIPNQGYATELLRTITEHADARKITLDLVAKQFGNSRGMNNKQLVSFYESFGFEFVRGSTAGVFMRRTPTEESSQDLQAP